MKKIRYIPLLCLSFVTAYLALLLVQMLRAFNASSSFMHHNHYVSYIISEVESLLETYRVRCKTKSVDTI